MARKPHLCAPAHPVGQFCTPRRRGKSREPKGGTRDSGEPGRGERRSGSDPSACGARRVSGQIGPGGVAVQRTRPRGVRRLVAQRRGESEVVTTRCLCGRPGMFGHLWLTPAGRAARPWHGHARPAPAGAGHRRQTRPAERAAEAGALGYVDKDREGAPERLVSAIRSVAAGRRFVDDSLGFGFLRATQIPLTRRELSVLSLAADGASVAEIAAGAPLPRNRAQLHGGHHPQDRSP